ncbi:MAG: glycosyltransferase family 4 protein [Bacteroidetes bacterium]|nr:glycosyltransferase family 4 protein [Bacteroidota bacterium]
MKKVLIITYYWPPSGGAGVQRWLKMSRYLPGFGISPVILTVHPDYATYPATDTSLLNEIPEGLEIHRTRAADYFRLLGRDKSGIPSAGFANEGSKGLLSLLARFVRGNLFIPDPRRGWNRFAFSKACRLIVENEITSFVTTGPPHSTHLIGLKLKRKFPSIRWTADLRDPWVDIFYNREFWPTALARLIDSRYESSVLESADNILAVGNELINLYSLKYPRIAEKFRLLRNGYDPSDFEGCKSSDPDIFTISYVGTISDAYKTDGLIMALKSLSSAGIRHILRFTGFISGNQRKKMESNLPGTIFEYTDYLSHREAISEMLRSSVLLLLVPYHKSSKLIITGKLFEYIATPKPILVVGPADGEAASIISELPNCKAAEYEDDKTITSFLIKAAKGELPARQYLAGNFTREEGAKTLSEII